MAKILIVDDEVSIRGLLDTVLTSKGHEVIVAACGRKAVQLFRCKHPHVTILDLNMPDMNGLTVLKAIRAADALAPVIILTGAGTETDEVEARALGVTGFLQKAFSLHALGETLDRALATHQSTTGL